jgi:plastocyanin
MVVYSIDKEKEMKRLLFVATVCAILLAACGGGGSSTTINVTLTDFQFTPAEFTIPAGKEIAVKAVNNGAVVHEFVIFKYGTDAGPTFGEEDEENIYWEVEVNPGQSANTSFTAPLEPGEYYLVCGTEGHMTAGMVGKVVVVAADP